jgi:murein DD-endopeptidase MepM/ murein hydrolase activator NlpD
MMRERMLQILMLALFSFTLHGELLAQNPYPKGYFRNPLDVPINLSGNFGELRTNHFHAGIDIKTMQQEGLKVYAAAEGFVSRIKVSPVGYGYALYIDHPNGYTTVYGHLKSYSARIDEYVKREQYRLKSFSVDLFPDSSLLKVVKGEVVALSGNTGGSGGPHLHFEVRETKSEKIINPLLFGFDVKDNIKPSVSGIWLVPMTDTTWINGGRIPVRYETAGSAGAVKLKSTTIPKVYGEVGFAIHTSDALDGNANRCGIYRIELWVDGLQVYGQRMDRLDFTTNRAMNAHTIYERFKKDRSQIHGSYRLPGNPLDIYDNLVDDGIVRFKDGKRHKIEYIVVDLMGNRSSVSFEVEAQTKAAGPAPKPGTYLATWNWEKDNEYKNEKIQIQMPALNLYEDLNLTITEGREISGAVTPTFKVASPYEPVHGKYTLSLNASKVPAQLKPKTIVARWDPDKQKISSEGGVEEGGWITANPQYLGFFALMIDTVKPGIQPVDFSASMKGKWSFTFKIYDGLSGVDQIIPKIDGEWALMEYDAKTSRLIYYFDKRYIQPGKHSFELTVIDAVGNERVYKSDFVY